jgi:hypothetical protein
MSACALVILVAIVPGPTPVSASSACTGWASEYQPPSTIRVYRTIGPAAGTVQSVAFRAYVETVLTGEFGFSTPPEALRAGAVAAKQYAWYHAMHWRGGRAPGGDCYDVVDSPLDQLYRPERYHPTDRQESAVAATWPVSLRKDGQFFMTGYRGGSNVSCGANADGWRLYQRSAYRCARDGLLAVAILRRFYGPGLEVVVPGAHDSTGEGLGDVTVLLPTGISLPGAAPAPEASALPTAAPSSGPSDQTEPALPPTSTAAGITARLYLGGDLPPSGVVPGTMPGWQLDPAATIGYGRIDVTGDRLDDLIVLQRAPDASLRLAVAVAAGGGAFADASTWWSSVGTGFDLSAQKQVRLVTGDFDGDGLGDAAILSGAQVASPAEGAPSGGGAVQPPAASLYLLRSTGVSFDEPSTWWSGSLDVEASVALGADADGDGRADLVVQTDVPGATLPGAGVPGSDVPASPAPVPGDASPAPGPGDASPAPVPGDASPVPDSSMEPGASPAPSPPEASTAPVEPAPPPGAPTAVAGIRFLVATSGVAPGLGDMRPWLDLPGTSAASARTVVADVNRDGRDDLVVDIPIQPTGSRFVGALSDGSSFTARTLWQGASFNWNTSKLAAADVNGDGRGDVVVLYDLRAGGTRLYRFVSTGSTLRAAGRSEDPTLPWSAAIPL